MRRTDLNRIRGECGQRDRGQAHEQETADELEQDHGATLPWCAHRGAERHARRCIPQALSRLPPHERRRGNRSSGVMNPTGLHAPLATYANQAVRTLQAGNNETAESMFETVRMVVENGRTKAPATLALCYRMLGQVHGSRPIAADAEVALAWFDKSIALSRGSQNRNELACGLH